ncbi:TcpQ domain-containing protein [Bordetella genomosp. 13]|uniref:Toxin co-regulated pilus biosynthesis protein Q C-terminal domain-containing protein n=1 Tax=Bordetella genomosp. 13 TaxID=463040 RepID=A0A1W6ZBV6_9BORD|nr:TcpQ domain-containing protein [Bordetella genomosp. 13]ARP94745.1 hypothetical protein CAL15_10310 [Bordetella genomosp. 13]
MVRWLGWALLLSAGGCTALGDGIFGGPGAGGQYDFNWQLSGDAAVAPLQVFASDAQVWMQFGAGQEVPAIFAGTPQGDRLVAWRRQGPYVVVDGAWPALTMRGGRYVARAARVGASSSAFAPQPPVSAVASAAAASAAAVAHDASVASIASVAPVAPVAASAAAASGTAPSPAPAAAASAARAGASSAGFQAGPPEMTLRAVLVKWAQAAGWTFQSQHWAVEVDIPLAGSAEFGSDFKQAVRALLASTELTERPVQPCFYTNRVLRVVPYTQACDRSAAPAGVQS